MLEVAGLTVRFGGVTALHDVELTVPDGSVCGLIGPNGAGKTTLFNCVSRLVEPAGRLDPLQRHRAARASARTRSPQLGIARTFQHLALIPSLTVRENVMLGAHYRARSGLPRRRAAAPAHPARGGRGDARTPTRRSSAWTSPRLADRPVAGLAYGQLKRVELARALCETPRLLALDEPASGLSHGEVDELADLLKQLTQELDLTLLLVEHHMGLVMKVSDQVAVLDFGRIIADRPARRGPQRRRR